MTLQPLTWSDPATNGFPSIESTEGTDRWRIVPVARDVTRVHFHGADADGVKVHSTGEIGYAESRDEAKILIDVLREGTDHLAGWREQLEAAGFVRTYPDEAATENLSVMWNDGREDGLFGINVFDGGQEGARNGEICVHATYEIDGEDGWHNVSSLDGRTYETKTYGPVSIRQGLPEGIDALKAGVAIALAIRAARTARGGDFVEPMGGETPDDRAKKPRRR